jgi:pimeloyl-ACP methyl ester carboxylesterase
MPPASIASEISTTVRSSSAPGSECPPRTETSRRTETFSAPRLVTRGVQVATRWFPNWTARWLVRQFLTPRARLRPLDLTGARQVLLRVGSHSFRLGLWGRGPLVLLVHGWAGSGEQFRLLREQLVGAGFTAASFDAPAHGGTPGLTSSLPEFVAAIEAVVLRLGPLHAIVGHSLGAAAAALYTRYRAAPGAGAPGLVLLAPMPGFRFAMDTFQQVLQLDNATRERVTTHLERSLGFSRAEMELAPLDLWSPTLLIHDANDRSVPLALSRELASAWAGALLHETNGLGHGRVLDDPAVTERIAAFVSQLPAERRSALERQLAQLDEAWPE